MNHCGRTEIYPCIAGSLFRVKKSVSDRLLFCSTLADNSGPVLLNLHRPYFAQALQESPADIQRHRYLPSIIATYRSAWRLSRGLAMTWMAVPRILARLTLPWSHALSAAVSHHSIFYNEAIYT